MDMESRTGIVAKNSSYSLVCHLLTLLLQFAVRTLFIKCLTVEYVGVQGLFSNILTVLSFAELGIGNAVSFSLYKPLAENNQYKVAQLMQFYKIVYRIIAAVVLIIGLCITPFLDSLVLERPNISENLSCIYIIFVINSAVSYLFVYKQTLILADQKKYIVSIYTIIVTAIICSLQCASLFLFKSFYAYLVIMVLGTVTTNVVISKKCDRLYPNILRNDIEPLEKNEKKSIFDNVKSLCLYKFGNVILNGSGNILVSKLFGVAILGVCSNFYYVINIGMGLFSQVLFSFVATIGNLNAVENDDRKTSVFFKISIFCFWLYGFICTGLYLYLNDFIYLWIGEEYMLNRFVVFSIVLVFYVDNVCFSLSSYRVTMGLFKKARFSPIIASIVNIILAIILSKFIGVAGVFLAVSISRFFCINLIDVYLVFKYGLRREGYKYLYFYLMFTLFFVIVAFLIGLFTYKLPHLDNAYLELMKNVIIYTLVFNVLFVLSFHKLPTFIELSKNLKLLILKR